MEGAEINEKTGQQAEMIQTADKTHQQLGQERHREHKCGKFVRIVLVDRLTVFGNKLVDLIIDGKNIIIPAINDSIAETKTLDAATSLAILATG